MAANPASRPRLVLRWALLAAGVILLGASCGASRPTAATRAAPTPTPPAMALAGTDSTTSRAFHLAAGTYLITWKGDGGQPLDGEVIVRGDQAGSETPPVVALLDGSTGSTTATLTAGQYVAAVVMLRPAPWEVTFTRTQ